MTIKIGVAGIGAIGNAVCKAITTQPDFGDMVLDCISDPAPTNTYSVDNVNFEELVERSDLIIECLPANIVPKLAALTFSANKDIIFISSAALLIYPEIIENLNNASSKAYLPSGALCGLDGVRAMKEMGINSAKIASTKPPMGFAGAPFIVETNLDLNAITETTLIFEGNAFDAARGFPANVNVAATLSLAGIGAQDTRVEIWADPLAKGNAHEITVQSDYSTMTSRIENLPDPANPKSSVLAAQSIVATLKSMNSALVIS